LEYIIKIYKVNWTCFKSYRSRVYVVGILWQIVTSCGVPAGYV